MNRITTVLLLTLALLLTGCGVHKFKQGDPLIGLEQSKEASKAACYRAQERSKIDTAGMSELGRVMLLQQQSYERMVAAFTGKSFDPCSGGTNLNDVLIADVTQRNETLRTGIRSGEGVVKFGLGVWGAVSVADSIGSNAGNKTTNNTEGGDANTTNTRTTSETHATSTNTGEEGTATSTPSGGATDVPVTPDPAVPPGVEIVDTPVTVTND